MRTKRTICGGEAHTGRAGKYGGRYTWRVDTHGGDIQRRELHTEGGLPGRSHARGELHIEGRHRWWGITYGGLCMEGRYKVRSYIEEELSTGRSYLQSELTQGGNCI